MGVRNWLAASIALAAATFSAQTAQAGLICSACQYGDEAATYIGTYSPTTLDFGTFEHSDVGIDAGLNTAFTDYWVFDLSPGGTGSISADFTMLTGISDFAAQLFADGGSACTGSDCSSVVTGALIASDASVGNERRWEIIVDDLPAGRYVIQVTGTTNNRGTSVYTGQLAFVVSGPATLALLGLGLLGMCPLLGRRQPERRVGEL
jgi:hypothetical protein